MHVFVKGDFESSSLKKKYAKYIFLVFNVFEWNFIAVTLTTININQRVHWRTFKPKVTGHFCTHTNENIYYPEECDL